MNWNCNFSYKHYFEVLDYAKKKYQIGPIRKISKFKDKGRFILLRHDIDFSLEYALELAKAEVNHGLKSTYFVLLHSPFYNALSKNGISSIRKISKLGHEIGLHYDTSFFPFSEKAQVQQLRFEAKILSKIVGKEVSSIAQHNVTISPRVNKKILKDFKDIRLSSDFNSVTYLSDSLQNWRNGCMCNHVGKVDKLQILTHPIWWSKQNKTVNIRLNEFKRDQIKNFNDDFNYIKKLQCTYLKKLHNKRKTK